MQKSHNRNIEGLRLHLGRRYSRLLLGMPLDTDGKTYSLALIDLLALIRFVLGV